MDFRLIFVKLGNCYDLHMNPPPNACVQNLVPKRSEMRL